MARQRKPQTIRIGSDGRRVSFRYARSPFVPKSAYQGLYEENETKFLFSNSPEFDVFVNIGANAGWYSLIAAKLGLRTCAVEPDEINFTLLEANAKLNNLPNLHAHKAACSNEEGSSLLYGGNSGSSLIRGWANLPEEGRLVQLMPYDNLHPSRDENAMVYIDVEGWELSVLEGMKSYLNSLRKCVMLVEITSHQHQPNSISTTRVETFDLLLNLGFEASFLQPNGRLRTYSDWGEEVSGVSFVFTKNYSPR